MVSEIVQLLAATFRDSWNPHRADIPLLALDNTWPSIGVIDLLTFSLRGQSQFGPEEKKILKRSAAYLAVITARCWELFRVKVEVDEGEAGIFIRATGGEHLREGQDFTVNIEEQLAKLFKSFPSPFPVIADFSRVVPPDYNLIDLVAVGLVTGLTPFGDGPWMSESPTTFKGNIDATVRHLAGSCADYYARVFPQEQLGQVAELYLNKLIYPPTMYNEPLPACNAVGGLLAFSRDYSVSEGAMFKLTHNLALFPDELIAQAGFAYAAAICPSAPSPALVARGEGYKTYAGMLRAAMVAVRAELGKKPDWICEGDFTAEDMERYDLEMLLGMLPWVRLSKSRIRQKKKDRSVLPILQALTLFDLREALKLIDRVIDESPGDLDMQFQRVYLDIIQGDFEQAAGKMKTLLTEPGAEKMPTLYYLWGLAELSLERNDAALKHFEAAYRILQPGEKLEAYQIANNYAWSLILNGNFPRALEVLDWAISNFVAPLTALLNKAYVHRQLEQYDEATAMQRLAAALNPLDRRVFANL